MTDKRKDLEKALTLMKKAHKCVDEADKLLLRVGAKLEEAKALEIEAKKLSA